MGEKDRFAFGKGDFAAIGLVALLAILIFAGGSLFFAVGNERTVKVYLDGELIREAPTDRDAVFEIDGKYASTLRISGGEVCVERSDCPTQDCVHMGKISGGGEVIVCLPNRLEIRISGDGESEVDAVIR